MTEELFKQMAQSILDGDEEVSADLAQQALDAGIDPLVAITDGYMPGVNEVGDSFACGQAFLPELVMAGEAMKSAIAVLEPAMKAAGTQRQILGKVVLATVEGDIHEIGKSLVGTMLTSSGFRSLRPGRGRANRRTDRQSQRSRCRHHRPERALDDHDGQAEGSHRRSHQTRHEGQGHGRGRTCDEGMGTQDRSGWLFGRCHRRGQCSQRVDGREITRITHHVSRITF